MDSSLAIGKHSSPPALRDVLELAKPVTWFPPMWAFVCGIVSAGVPLRQHWSLLAAGVLLAGPLLCGTSQVVNDWFDRDVDAINEPRRPIPSGRIAGRWGLWIAIAGSGLALVEAALIGRWILAAAMLGLACAWAYSAPPTRLKASGLWGPALVALTYEGLSWFTGASIMLGALPPPATLGIIALYSVGAWGIMTLNDFKAVTGDRATGVRSLPVTIGVRPAARIACAVMAVPQLVVVALLWSAGHVPSAAVVAALLAGQFVLMRRLLRDPAAYAPWYNATGTTLYVLGMMASALGLGGVAAL